MSIPERPLHPDDMPRGYDYEAEQDRLNDADLANDEAWLAEHNASDFARTHDLRRLRKSFDFALHSARVFRGKAMTDPRCREFWLTSALDEYSKARIIRAAIRAAEAAA